MKKKTVQLNKKLVFSKENIAHLNVSEQESLAGGAVTGTQPSCILAACGNVTINATCPLQCRSITCVTRKPLTPICLPG
ncbi:class I lanthipeptide [Taibaiella chishuiensis]|uniref:class I lanthipeptide n=1 Tax=Taibaiella chishuiensis TaxID=1434707 RepID=UPI000D0CDC37|nr:class I lanthipeptide [Taibaiella chishuiensis]